jgi:hypothetical protein
LDVLPKVAVMVEVVLVVTALVFTVNVAEVCPAEIVTDAGTVAVVELLLSEMTRPPAGAAEPIVTVP